MFSYRYTRPVLLEMAVATEESARDFYTTLGEIFLQEKPQKTQFKPKHPNKEVKNIPKNIMQLKSYTNRAEPLF